MADTNIITFRAEKKLAEELTKLQTYENLDRSTAARKAFELGLHEWKKQEAIKLILAGKISIDRAAEMLGLSLYKLIELLEEKRIDFISLNSEELDREVVAAKG